MSSRSNQSAAARDTPYVSVLMTTFNGARLIGQSIDSILGQSFTDLELVVVDDGSTDGTAQLLKAYTDKRLRVVRSGRNLGVVGSRNLGFALCRGRYVAASDHDDISRPTRLMEQVAYLDRNPDTVLLATLSHDFESGAFWPFAKPAPTEPAVLEWLLHLGNPLTYSSIMVRADAVRRLGVFARSERLYADDFDLYHRLMRLGRIARLNTPLVIYRRHGGNTSRLREMQMLVNSSRVLAEAYLPWFGHQAATAAELVTRLVSGRRIAENRADLDRLGEVIERLLDAFVRARGLSREQRSAIQKEAAVIWRRLVQRHLQAGRLGSLTRLWSRPALARPAARDRRTTIKALAIGALPGRQHIGTALHRRSRFGTGAGRAVCPERAQLHEIDYLPTNLEAERPPTLFVVVDTEAEFDWSQAFSRDLVNVSSIAGQHRAQTIFDGYGLRPVYVVDYPVATQTESVGLLRKILERGGCEIGAHLHPWTTPPLHEEPSARNSYPGNLPRHLEARKLATLVQAIRESFGTEPLFYKAGRYGIGPNTMALVAEQGIKVDFSVLPRTDLRPQGGPDLRMLMAAPYAVANFGLLCLPMTREFTGLLARFGAAIGSATRGGVLELLKIPGVLAKLRLLDAITLTPEGVTAAEQIRLLRAMLSRGHRIFVLHYHSPSLVPGHTPYVRSALDSAAFLARIETVLGFFFETVGGLPGNPRDLLPVGLRARHVSSGKDASAARIAEPAG